jgi:prepilin-type N-terminal cleavage/methylation domain-containing protein
MRQQGRAGFTLIELMISLTMLGIVLGALTTVMVSMQRGYTRQREIARSEDALRNAELIISSILRSARANPRNLGGAGRPRLDPGAAPPFNALRVVADFNPIDNLVTGLLEDVAVRTLNDTLYVRWQFGGADVAVAFPVRSLLFVYDSSGTALTTNADVARAANRVRLTIQAPRHSQTAVLARRDTWIYLRNRSSQP